MIGTSTDVSRYGSGRYEHVFETTTAGVTIQSPQLDINTVAAGGGSRLFFRNGLFVRITCSFSFVHDRDLWFLGSQKVDYVSITNMHILKVVGPESAVRQNVFIVDTTPNIHVGRTSGTSMLQKGRTGHCHGCESLSWPPLT